MPSDREAAGNGSPVPGRGSAGSRKKLQAEAGRAGGRSGPLLRAGSRPWGGRCACAGTAVSLPEVEGLTGESRWVSAPGGRNARESRPSAPDYHVSLRHQPLRGPNGREPLPGRASYVALPRAEGHHPGLFRQCPETWRGRDGPTAQWESGLSRLAYRGACGAVPAAGGRPEGLGAGGRGGGGTLWLPRQSPLAGLPGGGLEQTGGSPSVRGRTALTTRAR